MELLVEMPFGSHLYGTATEKSDKDHKGVFLPTLEDMLLQRVSKSIHTSSKQGVGKNSPDDVDRELYSLHYFLHLACKGETVALDMLHAPLATCSPLHPIWVELVALREQFYTSNLKAFVGYARRQAAKYGVKGSRLSAVKAVLEFMLAQPSSVRVRDVWDQLPMGEHIYKTSNQQDEIYEVCGKRLIATGYCFHYVDMLQHFAQQYGARARQAEANEGIDWKAVSHALRAAYQVKHILQDGGYSYPLPETPLLRQVKSGALDFATEVAPALDALMDELERLSAKSLLPQQVNEKFWDHWLLSKLQAAYSFKGNP